MLDKVDSRVEQQELLKLNAENEMFREIIENFPGGVIAYDENLRVIVCNTRQKELLEYPPYLFEYGMPTLENVFRFNATRGEYGPGDVEQQVHERLTLAAKREPHHFTRIRPNGMCIEVRGQPLPHGGFVTCYTEQQRTQDRLTSHDLRPDRREKKVLTEMEFLERLEEVCANTHASRVNAVHYIELSNSNELTQKFGPSGREIVIDVIEKRVTGKLRVSDLVGRLDSALAVLQFGIERPSDVMKLQHRIMEACKSPIALATSEVRCELTVGVALSPRDGRNAITLLAKAKSG